MLPIEDKRENPSTVYDAPHLKGVKVRSLSSLIVADIAIVGGGFVGISAALKAAESGRSVVLLEGHKIGWGSAARNAGQVSAHSSKLEPDAVVRTYGEVYGPRMNAAGASAPELVLGLADRYGFDVSPVRGGIVTGAHWRGTADKLRNRAAFWQDAGADVVWLDRAALADVVGSNFYYGGVLDRRAIAINPLAFIYGLAAAAVRAGVQIFQESPVVGFEQQGNEWLVRTAGGAVRARKVIMGTNAYTGDLWPGLKETFVPVRGYQIWTKPLPEATRGTVMRGISAMLDTRRLLTGMRLHPDGRLQFSGGIGFGAERTPDFKASFERVRQILPQLTELEVEGWWSGWVTRGIADGWRLHELAPGLTTAIGCNGRGVAMGVVMGQALADYACGIPASDLVLPFSKPQRVSGMQVHRPVGALVQRYFGWKDRRELQQEQSFRRRDLRSAG